MTFAVINTGGKQYKVTTNDKLRIEKLSNEEGKSILFDKVELVQSTLYDQVRLIKFYMKNKLR